MTTSATNQPRPDPTAADDAAPDTLPGWSRFDRRWMIALTGTAVGAGILFLPIDAGMGGFWPLLIATLLIGPMSYLSHRGLSRMICASPQPSPDITEVVADYFGQASGRLFTVLYFLSILPVVLIYGVGITNTVNSLMIHQLDMTPWPRWLLSAVLVGLLTFVMVCGKQVMLVVTQWLVYPLIAVLGLVTLYLIPSWSFQGFTDLPATGDFLMALWLMIPVLVFSFNYSPAVSQFSVSLQRRYGSASARKASVVLWRTTALLTLFTMGFVWSAVLAIGPEGLAEARESNLPILSYLANDMHTPLMAWLGPFISAAAISSSYFGHWLGAHEGLVSIIHTNIDPRGRRLDNRRLNALATLLLAGITWIVAIINPSILSLIESLIGPFIAAMLYLLPMYAIHRIDALARFRGRLSNVFVVIAGLVACSGVLLTWIEG